MTLSVDEIQNCIEQVRVLAVGVLDLTVMIMLMMMIVSRMMMCECVQVEVSAWMNQFQPSGPQSVIETARLVGTAKSAPYLRKTLI